VKSKATLAVRLPSAPVFEKASQDGRDGDVAFDLPWTLRAGIEVRFVRDLKVELAANYDRNSLHDSITFTPSRIAFKNVVGLPAAYYVAPVSIPRGFQDSVAIHLGSEYAFELGGLVWEARGGASFETSAIPSAYESVLTIDQEKITTALGASVHVGKLRFDVTYAHVFGFDVNVDPKDAKIALINPVQATPPKVPNIINAGSYSARADALGIGMTYTFGASTADRL